MKQLFYLLSFLLFSVSSINAQDAEYYISPNGNDNNNGTLATPFQTLERARDEIRTANHTGHVTVWLMDGVYNRTNTFELTVQDSGTSNAEITYAALNKHGAVLNFDTAIPTTDFNPVTDPALVARLTPEAVGNVVQIDLNALGIQVPTWPATFRAENQELIRLYAGGDLLPLSRYPNDSMMTMKTVLQNEPGIFEYRGNRHSRWLEAVNEGLWLQGYWRVAWQYDAILTASIDTVARTVTQAVPISLGIGSKYHRPEGNGLEPYIATNLIDEIDIPGEWSVNLNTKMLYVWIPNGVSEIRIIDKTSPVFRLTDVSHVNIENIKFDYGLGSAIEINDGNDNLLAGCEISNFIETAVVINNGFNHEITSNDLHHLGAGGIYLSGGDRPTLTPANHRAVNNHIYEFGIVQVIYGAAIEIPGKGNLNNVGMYVAHNKVHGTPHVGIAFGGNNNIFEYNEVYDYCRVSNDMGAFYAWNDAYSYGNVFRYNYVHDAPGLAHGFYMDDYDGGDMVYNNVVQNISRAVYIQGGRDITVHNNLIINCEKGVYINNRLFSLLGSSLHDSWLAQLNAIDYANPPWSDEFPEIMSIVNGDYEGQPAGSSIDCNVTINTTESVNIDATTATTWDVDLGTNYSNTDASLNTASLVDIAAACSYNGVDCIGLIPYDKIGLISDEYRTISTPSTAACDDNDPCTTSDQYNANCHCVGIALDNVSDLDNDGICDSGDYCPSFDNNLIGTPCDDGEPCTALSIYDFNCNCSPSLNYALLGTPSMSSHYSSANANSMRLIDGIIDNSSIAHTNNTTSNEWMEIDLGITKNIEQIVIWNRTNCCGDRLDNVYVLVSNTPFPNNTDLNAAMANADFVDQLTDVSLKATISVNVSQAGRYVRLQKSGNNPGGDYMNILELQIMGNDFVDTNANGLPDDCEEVELNLSVILEGAFDPTTNLMRTTLREENIIPSNQPYSVAPYNYMGIESASTIPSNVVDWILVEARTGTTNSTKVEAKAGFLLNNGNIVDTDGISPLLFDLPPNSDVYFVVRHRNHLDVMTANSMTRNLNMAYDFTVPNSAFGTNQQNTLVNGQAAMIPADMTQDHVIQTTDYDYWQSGSAILNVYDVKDVNLDGSVQASDYDLWYLNKAKVGPAELGY